MARLFYKVPIVVLVLIFAILLTKGCSLGNRQFKFEVVDELSDCENFFSAYYIDGVDCREDEPSERKNVKFAIVELDDFGEFFDRKQSAAAIQGLTESASESPTLFITYIHGWRHNASESSKNLRDFRDLVFDLSKNMCILDELHCRYKNVVGLYIGWRGDSFGLSPTFQNTLTYGLQTATFWDRLEASKNIANTNATHLLLKLQSTLRKTDYKRLSLSYGKYGSVWNGYYDIEHFLRKKVIGASYVYSSIGQFLDDSRVPTCTSLAYAQYIENESCSKTIIIGHSMGARILEQAVSQAYIGARSSKENFNQNVVEKELTLEAKVVSRLRENAIKVRTDYVNLAKAEASEKNAISDDLIKLGLRFDRQRDDYILSRNNFLRASSSLERIYEESDFPPFDLAVMVNPATSSLSSRMLKNALCNKITKRSRIQNPWLISVSSETDFATKNIFKWASWSKNIFSIFSVKPDTKIGSRIGVFSLCAASLPYSQSYLSARTGPFIEELQTHKIDSVPKNATPSECENVNSLSDQATLLDGVRDGMSIVKNRIRIGLSKYIPYAYNDCNRYLGIYKDKQFEFEFEFNVSSGRPDNISRKKWSEAVERQESGLLPNEYFPEVDFTVPEYDDYWMFNLPSEIVPDHNTIFTYEFGKFLTVLLGKNEINGAACANGADLNAKCGLLKAKIYAAFGQWPENEHFGDPDYLHLSGTPQGFGKMPVIPSIEKKTWSGGFGRLSLDLYETSDIVPVECLQDQSRFAYVNGMDYRRSKLIRFLDC